MKKNKKLSKGMTLVEVIVAMTVFAIMSATILTVIGFAMQQSSRNRQRDLETAQQANAVEKQSSNEVSVLGSGLKIQFSTEIDPVNNVTAYEADEAQFGTDFGFQLKTLVKGNLGGLSTTNDATEGEYLITIKNNTSEDVTAYVTIASGYIFEGNTSDTTKNCYTHTSAYYTRTVKAAGNSGAFGYSNSAYASATDLQINLVSASKKMATVTFDPSLFNSKKKEVTLTVDSISGASLTTTTTYTT